VLGILASITILAIGWSSTEDAVVNAFTNDCYCAGSGQVFSGGNQVGGDSWNNGPYYVYDNVACANTCQSQASSVGAALCAAHSADTYTTQWYWQYAPGSPSSGYLEQQYGC